jgi:hypothetical protein
MLPYPRFLYRELINIAPRQRVDERIDQLVGERFKDFHAAYQGEASTHRDHNINSNFDNIEVSGVYDQTVRTAINIVTQELFDQGLIRPEDAGRFSLLLRIADPTDRLILRQKKPSYIDWVSGHSSQEEFAAFVDWDSLAKRISVPSQAWVPLFEQTEHRFSEGMGAARPTRMSKALTSLFVAAKQAGEPAQDDLDDLLNDWVNMYRFELPHVGFGESSPNLERKPLAMAQISTREFRGSKMTTIATVPPSLARLLELEPTIADYLGLRFGEQVVVRSTEWQEGYDQGRRRHLPISSGFLLEMEKEFLKKWVRANNLRLWMNMKVSRSVTQYREESQMHWEERADVIEVRL